jgi:uncharacterized OB-fold protein
LYSFAVAVHAYHPAMADRIPYFLAIVELAEQPGLKLLSNVVDCDESELRVDAPVEVTFREVAPKLVLPQFVLTQQGSDQ